MKNLYLILVLLTLYGCGLKSSKVNYVYVALKTEASEEIKFKMNAEKSVYLELGIIPGALYGAPLGEPLWYVDLDESSLPKLNITNLEAELSKVAKPLDTELPYNDLEVFPSNARIVRVSTFGNDVNAKQRLGSSFHDQSGKYFFLVYFDRPCTIRGKLDVGGQGAFNHDVEIPHSGLYRLAATDSKIVRASQSIEPIYVQLH